MRNWVRLRTLFALLAIAVVCFLFVAFWARGRREVPYDQVSQALIGKQITIRGKLSLRCKLPVCILLDNHQVVYLMQSSTREQSYSEMEDKLVAVTGILRFYHDPDAASRPSDVARLPDCFYFEAETARVRLIGQ